QRRLTFGRVVEEHIFSIMRPHWVGRSGLRQLGPFLGFHVKKHKMVRIRMSGNVVAMRRKSGYPHALRTVHGRELLCLQVQLIDGTRRNFPRVSWPVSEK